MLRQIIRIFLCLTFLHVLDCSACSVSTECNSGEYCEIDSFTGEGICSTCTNLPAGARYTGSGADNQPTSCPWTLSCQGNIYGFDLVNGCIPCGQDEGPTYPYPITIKWDGSNYFLNYNQIEQSDFPKCLPQTKCENIPALFAECLTGDITGKALGNDYSTCKCETEVSISNGTGTKTCLYTANGTLSTNCSTFVKTCDAGYYKYAPSNTCEITQAGCYSPANDMSAYDCPPGSTTAGTGAKSGTECYYTSGTEFTDSHGSYTLEPLDSSIKAYVTRELAEQYPIPCGTSSPTITPPAP